MEKNTLQNSLNELSKGTTNDVDSIMIRDAAGNQYWIAKADLASVLGELIPVATTTQKGLMPSDQKWNINNWETYTGNLNDIKRESRLVINQNTKNNPINQWAVCETVYINSGFSLQKVYEYFAARTIYVRSYNNSAWSGWTKIVG